MQKSTIALSVVMSCILLGHTVDASAIPIWEFQTYEEKLGRLLYIFIHLVGEYCKTSDIPDCRRTLSLHGISNLLIKDEASLDVLDPYQRDGHVLVWQAAMKNTFKAPDSITKASTRLLQEALFGLSDLTEDDPAPTSRIRLAAPRPPHIFR